MLLTAFSMQTATAGIPAIGSRRRARLALYARLVSKAMVANPIALVHGKVVILEGSSQRNGPESKPSFGTLVGVRQIGGHSLRRHA